MLLPLAAWGQTSPTPETKKRNILFQQLERDVRKVQSEVDGVMALSIHDLTSGEEMLINADEIMPQASSIKITVLAELYRQVQAGKLKLTDEYVMSRSDIADETDLLAGMTPGLTKLTLNDLATFMIAWSDNSATNVLISRVGMDNVNSMLDSAGLHNTRLRRKMIDLKAASEGRENVSTAREMSRLLTLLYEGKILDKPTTDAFFKKLETHKPDWHLLRDLPDTVVGATKHGWLEGVRNDSGVIFVKGRPYVICVMFTYLRDERQGEEAISRISKLTWQYFDRVARASEYGRVISPK